MWHNWRTSLVERSNPDSNLDLGCCDEARRGREGRGAERERAREQDNDASGKPVIDSGSVAPVRRASYSRSTTGTAPPTPTDRTCGIGAKKDKAMAAEVEEDAATPQPRAVGMAAA